MTIEEGAPCPACKRDVLGYHPRGECSCHIYPPCAACVDLPLSCEVCGWEEDDNLEKSAE